MFNNSETKRILAVIQEPLSIEPQPFDKYATKLGMDLPEFFKLVKNFLQSGIIRRFAGIVKHDKAGFNVNAMIAFEVEDSECDNAGALLSKLEFISHCYKRTVYPDWKSNLYAMMHARNNDEFTHNIEIMKSLFIYKSVTILPSVKEFKKTHYIYS